MRRVRIWDLGFGILVLERNTPDFQAGVFCFCCVYQTRASGFKDSDFVGDAGGFGEHGLG